MPTPTTTTTTTTTAGAAQQAVPSASGGPDDATRERLLRYEHSKLAQPGAAVVLDRTDGLQEVLSASARRSGGTALPLVRIKRRLVEAGATSGGGGEEHSGDGDDDDGDDDDGDDDDGDDAMVYDDDDAHNGDDSDDGPAEEDGALAPLASSAFPELAGAHNMIETVRRQQLQAVRVETLEQAALAAASAATTTTTTAAARGAPVVAAEPRATQRRPRFRETGRLARGLQNEHRTLSTTTIASFSVLRREFSSALEGGAGVGAGAAGANGTGTGVAVPADTDSSETEINAFYRALLEREPYWIAAAKAEDALCDAVVPTMPALSAAYCRAYMREPYGGRRPCMRAAAERCVAQTLLEHPQGPFALMELLTPAEDALFRRTGELPASSRLCELCVRHYVGYRWNTAKLNNHVAPVTLNPHTHVVGVPGGYRLEACIQQVPGFSDGIFGPFRHFDASEFEPCVETVVVGGARVRVRGFDEAAATFF